MDFPFVKEALANLFRKSSCDMYPVLPKEAPANYRGRVVYDPEKCINCGMCESVCAGGAITRTEVPAEDGQTKVIFRVDLGSCTFCANCTQFCNSGAIRMSDDYHMIAEKDEDLYVIGEFIKAPKKIPVRADGCIYCTLCAKKCPAGALSVDRAAKTWELNADACIGCGTCVTACPKKVITLE